MIRILAAFVFALLIAFPGVASAQTKPDTPGAAPTQTNPGASQQTNPAAPGPAQMSAAPAAPGQSQQLLNSGQLDALAAPIALYPDPLIAEILMASTYLSRSSRPRAGWRRTRGSKALSSKPRSARRAGTRASNR
jgi:Protein of unknown function (DUF3300)